MKITYKGNNKTFYWNKALTLGKTYQTDLDGIFLDDKGNRVMYVPEIHEYFGLVGVKQDDFKGNS